MNIRWNGSVGLLVFSSMAALLCLPGETAGAVAPAPTTLYIGTYTGAKSQGIYLAHFNPLNGALTPPELAAPAENPSFLAIHPNRPFLYAVNETSQFKGQPGGAVTAFGIDGASGRLTQLNQQPTRGAAPCHLAVDRSGRFVLVANYTGGSVAVFPIQEDGRLGEATAFVQHEGSSVNQRRQAGPHAHGVYLDPANRFALVPDLGLDKVMVYRFSALDGSLKPNDPPGAALPPGSGPRHLAFDPTGHRVYVINELASTVSAFEYQAEAGTLREIQNVSTLGPGATDNNTTAEVALHPSGRFLYGSNRGQDNLAVFDVDAASGQLKLIDHGSTQGKTPRHFTIDSEGNWLLAADQDSDRVVVFRIGPASGKLTATGRHVEVGRPVCLVFPLPAAHNR